MEKELLNSESIRNVIKEKFLEVNPAVANSVKQLSFYLRRNKTKADKSTLQRFNNFLQTQKLLSLFERVTTETSDIPDDAYQSALEQINNIQLDAKSDKNKVILNQVLEMYRGYIERFDSDEKVIFKKPWSESIVYGAAKNAKTGVEYLGSNAYLLELIQADKNLDLPLFLNRHNLKELELSIPEPLAIGQNLVRAYLNEKLENSHPDKWLIPKAYNQLSDIEKQNYQLKNVLRNFELFHHSQFKNGLVDCEKYQSWIKEYKETALLSELKKCQNEEQRKRLYEPRIYAMTEYINASRQMMNVGLKEDPISCHYSPSKDQICMVNSTKFNTEHADLAYLGIYAHELTHSTGHSSRLSRNLMGKFGSKNYGFEELIAEGGSQLLLKSAKLTNVIDEQSANYVYSWLKSQNTSSGKDFLKIALNQAQLAANWISAYGKKYQEQVINNLDISHYRKQSILSDGDKKPHIDLLIQAEYINSVAVRHIEKFFNQKFSDSSIDKLITLTGQLLSSPMQQYKLVEKFNNYLLKNTGFTVSDATSAGKFVKQFDLPDIFSTPINTTFKPPFLIEQFHKKLGRDKVPEYLQSCEEHRHKFSSDKSVLNEIAKLTDKHYLLSVKPESKVARRLNR